MNIKTGLVGIDRGISYQSIAEQLYIEPHQGIKSVSFSRAQVRRALAGLERVGLIQFQSEEKQLILKCLLAFKDFSAQKKAVTNQSQQAVSSAKEKAFENTGFLDYQTQEADIGKLSKADIPHNINNNLFLYTHFHQFWETYPNKKSQQKAWEAFQTINPNEELAEQMLQALETQIQHHERLQATGHWVPAWKYPANWLIQQCWTDELTSITNSEQKNAKYAAHSTKKSAVDLISESCGDAPFDFEDEPEASTTPSNIVQFRSA